MLSLRGEDLRVTSPQQSSNEARSILPGAARLVRPGLVSDGRVAQQVLRELRGGKVAPATAPFRITNSPPMLIGVSGGASPRRRSSAIRSGANPRRASVVS